MKLCTYCNTTKTEIDFPTNSHVCTKCITIKSREHKRTRKGLIWDIYSKQKQSSKKRNHPKPAYSKKLFTECMLSHPLFESLYQAWVDSNYDTELRPSVDRIDDSIGYQAGNIQLITWGENRSKQVCSNPTESSYRPVNQYTLTGTFVTTYSSIREAARALNVSSSHITKVCKGTRKSAYGFIWIYTPDTP